MKIIIADKALKEIAKLGHVASAKILDFLEEMEQNNIDSRYKGKEMKGKFRKLWRYRVGDYRVISEIKDDIQIILVVRAGHRRNVYG